MKMFLFVFLSFVFWGCTDSELVDMHQISNGAQLYKMHCANCHQEDGSGLAKLIPPLKKSDYFLSAAKKLPCLIKNGNSGPVTVNGIVYTQEMPAAKGLEDEEILNICKFVLQKYPENPIQLPDSVLLAALKNCN